MSHKKREKEKHECGVREERRRASWLCDEVHTVTPRSWEKMNGFLQLFLPYAL